MDAYRFVKARWPIPLEELKARRDQCRKRENLVSGIWLVAFFVLLGLNIPFAQWITEQQKTHSWIGITYGICFFGFLFANVAFLFTAGRRRLRAYDLVCPHCGCLLARGLIPLAITTGRCGLCGGQLVSDVQGAE